MKKFFGLGFLALMLVSFQNCSRVAFDSVDSGLTKSGFVAGPAVEDVVIDKDVVSETENIIIVEDKKDDAVVTNDEVLTDDKKDEAVVTNDEILTDDKKDADIVANDEVADDKENQGKKDEEKKTDNLTEEEVELIACASDEGGDEQKVLVCHYPPGNPAARKTLCIGRPALKAHLHHDSDHKDTVGACADEVAAAE